MCVNSRHYHIDRADQHLHQILKHRGGLRMRSTTGYRMTSFPDRKIISRQGNSRGIRWYVSIYTSTESRCRNKGSNRAPVFHAILQHQCKVFLVRSLCLCLADEECATQKRRPGITNGSRCEVCIFSTLAARTYSLHISAHAYHVWSQHPAQQLWQ